MLSSAACGLLLAVSCSSPPGGAGAESDNGQDVLRGTLLFAEPTVLPKSAQIHVTLTKASVAPGEVSPVVARATLKPPATETIPFELPVDPSALEAGAEYLLLANVVLDGQSLYSNLALPTRVLGGTPAGSAAVVLRPERSTILP